MLWNKISDNNVSHEIRREHLLAFLIDPISDV
jgi:hypothetical protein